MFHLPPPESGLRCLWVALLFSFLLNQATGQGETFPVLAVFDAESIRVSEEPALRESLRSGSVLSLNPSILQEWRSGAPAQLTLRLPLQGDSLQPLQLSAHTLQPKVRSAGFRSHSRAATHALHYHGHFPDIPNSHAAISVLDSSLMGLIITPNGQYVLGPLEGRLDQYVLYREKDLAAKHPFTCSTKDEPVDMSRLAPTEREPGDTLVRECVRVSLEINHNVYLDKGGLNETVQFIEGLFNQVQLLYEQENIGMELSELIIWDLPSPYTGPPAIDYLNQFIQFTDDFEGDLSQLIGYGGGGGVAFVNQLCKKNPDIRKSYSGITPNFKGVPVYSWSVHVVAHELGHTLGSPHTHNCVWKQSNQAIDGCYPIVGNCPDPGLPDGGGTIMSYCHLTSVGVNFAKGFGPEPGNLIRQKVGAATCLLACQPDTPPSDTTGNEPGDTTIIDPPVDTTVTDTTGNDPEPPIDTTGTDTTGNQGDTIVPYCHSIGLFTAFEYIDSFRFGDFLWVSGDDGGYGDFTAGPPLFCWPKQEAELILVPFQQSFSKLLYWQIWLDMNGDGDFEDAGERLLQDTSSGPMIGSLLIPSGFTADSSRLRIAMNHHGFEGPCDTFSLGEVEDYLVIRTTGPPTPPNANCPENRILTGVPYLPPGMYQAAQTITTEQFSVKKKSAVIITAGEYILLKDPLQVEKGGRMELRIQPCSPSPGQ